MSKISEKRRCRIGPGLALSAALLAGCGAEPDLSLVVAERVKPVQRYDITQALASNGKFVVAGTQSGAVLVSADQGRTWTRTGLGAASIIGLAACPDGSFIGIDFHHKLWSGKDDGSGWKSVPLEKPHIPLAVTCDRQGRWWVAGTGTMLAVSSNRGGSWRVTSLGRDAQLTTIEFMDERHAIATGEFGTVMTSGDGGETWQARGRMPDDFYPYATVFTSTKEGWSSGIAGQMLRTVDGGLTWRKVPPAPAPLYRLFLHDGIPHGVGAEGLVARLQDGVWRGRPYPDAAPVFLGAATSLPGQAALVAGGPGGLLRVIGTRTQ